MFDTGHVKIQVWISLRICGTRTAVNKQHSAKLNNLQQMFPGGMGQNYS